MSNSRRIRYREQLTTCGEYLFVNIFTYFLIVRSDRRKARRAVSRAAVERVNQKNRENETNRVICTNFTENDLFLTLTYEIACASQKQASRDFLNFIKRLNRLRKRHGLPAVRWLKAIEGGSGKRIHIHAILTGGLSSQDIGATWGKGFIYCEPLTFDNDGCKCLAAYFCKGSSEERGSTPRSKSRRWTCSRNCERPKPKVNDSKYSRRRVKEIAARARTDDRRALDTLYEGYECANARSFFTDEFGFDYIYLVFRRKETPRAKSQRTEMNRTIIQNERGLQT